MCSVENKNSLIKTYNISLSQQSAILITVLIFQSSCPTWGRVIWWARAVSRGPLCARIISPQYGSLETAL